MSSRTWRILAVLALAAVVVSMSADAEAARRSSLASNQFINDPDDMFAFPQLMLKYKDRVIFDLAPGGDDGSGSVVFGDESVLMFNTGRSDFLNNTATWAFGGADRYSNYLFGMNGIPGSNGASGNLLEWWDLGYAAEFGGNPWGFNVSWAKDKNKFTPDGADPTLDNKTTMLGFQVGTTINNVEFAGEVGFGSYKDELVGLTPSDVNDFSFFNFALAARGNVQAFGEDWRWIAAFANGKSEPKAPNAASWSTTAFRGSFGPVWGTPGQWEVATYMSFEYVSQEMEGTDPDLVDTGKYLSFPAYNMAMEYYLNDWFVLRGGVMSHNATDKFEEEIPGGGTDEGEERTYDFMWTAGVGVDKGTWGVDMALNESDVHSGYLPFNGDPGSNAIAFMSLWLAW